ncbi:non-heme iron oxygenase ferredoxin subunit [bacterium]|nr:non-heme iron oxygenase ferredoxin subunit [bacterium]OIO83466.1 MAG: biphenyl 2,3-dioxygenase [Anaerolineae bacterium CG2_30_58_95]PIW20507.1 MAG: biphenyl 2,3-dioxygenase [Anaerolineae bacterium CG17_big_fil_post_rev_8_21_14_2_50_57_27]PIX47664.1 MAG: biphenyl 2,3-dioxygenase [Anaerolineae bacterium CG_4_8_14_3_um_filter_59_70]PIZ25420.1 MAG: biphenyl 2,3-dioxygenase [Chloroflexi bacterium CG_4_10_14_0_8_um_filter_57_5]PJH76403.1 MAG: biphenyl 2,3-dioxygenase [Anaerolineae bacterium CG_4_
MFDYTQLDPAKVEFVEIAPASELPAGGRLFVTIEDKSIVIFNVAGSLYAIADLCSHDNGPLGDGDLEGDEVICPRHGARFDIRTGKTMGLPAVVDIPAYPVRVREGMIEIGIPRGQ